MRTLSVRTAATHLSRLVDEVAAGEEIVIVKAGKPLGRLVSFASAGEPRWPGSMKGRIWIAEDFDAPLPEEVTACFRGERP